MLVPKAAPAANSSHFLCCHSSPIPQPCSTHLPLALLAVSQHVEGQQLQG